jgi:outer membrane protein OmpA-like peptidoglycan-associated protein
MAVEDQVAPALPAPVPVEASPQVVPEPAIVGKTVPTPVVPATPAVPEPAVVPPAQPVAAAGSAQPVTAIAAEASPSAPTAAVPDATATAAQPTAVAAPVPPAGPAVVPAAPTVSAEVPAAVLAPAAPSAPTVPPPPAAAVAAAPAAPVAAAPVAAAPVTVDEVYRRKLSEFTRGSAAPTAVPTAAPAALSGSAADSSRITLIPPSEYHRLATHDNGGARPLSAFDPSRSAASFQVASVVFGEGTIALSTGEQTHLKEVARLYHERPGASIRIAGHSASPRLDVNAKANRDANRDLAALRAAAIAHELVKMGVPGHKIYAGPAENLGGAGEAAEIYIDY